MLRKSYSSLPVIRSSLLRSLSKSQPLVSASNPQITKRLLGTDSILSDINNKSLAFNNKSVHRKSLSTSSLRSSKSLPSLSSSKSGSSSSSPSPSSIIAGSIISILTLYGLGTWVVWTIGESNETIYNSFDKYVPFGHRILEILEERRYHEKLRARQQFYESQHEVKPYISKAYHDVEEEEEGYDYKTSSSPLTSALSPSLSQYDDYYDDDDSHHHHVSFASATSATSSSKSASSSSWEPSPWDTEEIGETKPTSRTRRRSSSSEDPLSPERFFDAQSGTVGTRVRDYLPLVLLPDIRDPLIHDISMSLNDLISSVNASAVSDETVYSVAKLFNQLSDDLEKKKILENDSHVFRHEAQVLEGLVKTYRLLRERRQHEVAGTTGVLDNDQIEYERRLHRQYSDKYHRQLASEILKAERILVAHCNTRNSRSFNKSTTSSGTNPISQFSSSSSSSPAISAVSSVSSSSSSSSSSSMSPSFSRPSLDLIELQLSLTLLISALHNGANLPIAPYIQGIKTAIASSSSSNKEELIREALKGVKIPDDVDLKPILRDILSDGTK